MWKGLRCKTALKLEFESPHLPLVVCTVLMETLVIGQNLLNTFMRVYCKSSFDENIKMTYILSALGGEAKKL